MPIDQEMQTNADVPLPSVGASLVARRQANVIIVGCFAALMMGSLWAVGVWAFERSLSEMREKLDARMSLYAANIVSALEKHEYLPVLLSRDPMIQQLFEAGGPVRLDHDRINRHLSVIQQTAEVSAVYVMDRNGTTVVASNWDQEDSFVGQNFQFRPYFKNAMKGRQGYYFALGTTSKIPGYYVSYPLGDLENPVGVIVVKVSLARLEEAWARAQDTVFVSDANGVVIVASAQEWLFRTIAPIKQTQRVTFVKTRQYAETPLKPLQIARAEQVDGHTQRMHLRYPNAEGSHSAPLDHEKWMSTYIHQKPVLGTEWMLHYVFKASELRKDVIDAVLSAALIWGVIIALILVLLQRRRVIFARLQLQEQRRDMLQQAATDLEHRVERRTLALQQANENLEQEIVVRMKAQQQARETQDELIQAAKLAAIGQMAAGMTHEMNQPVTAIRNYAETAQAFMTRGSPHIAEQNLGHIMNLCDRLGAIAGQLKVFARKAPVQVQTVCVLDHIEEALGLLRSGTHLDDMTIERSFDLDAHWAQADPIRLVQVLVNVIRNAMDAVAGCAIQRIDIATHREVDFVHITVRDTGRGIDPVHLSQVFDPFFTTKEVGEGLGLGLSISSRIMQDFEGRLQAHNHPDGGAVFVLILKAEDGAKP